MKSLFWLPPKQTDAGNGGDGENHAVISSEQWLLLLGKGVGGTWKSQRDFMRVQDLKKAFLRVY